MSLFPEIIRELIAQWRRGVADSKRSSETEFRPAFVMALRSDWRASADEGGKISFTRPSRNPSERSETSPAVADMTSAGLGSQSGTSANSSDSKRLPGIGAGLGWRGPAGGIAGEGGIGMSGNRPLRCSGEIAAGCPAESVGIRRGISQMAATSVRRTGTSHHALRRFEGAGGRFMSRLFREGMSAAVPPDRSGAFLPYSREIRGESG